MDSTSISNKHILLEMEPISEQARKLRSITNIMSAADVNLRYEGWEVRDSMDILWGMANQLAIDLKTLSDSIKVGTI